MWHPCRQADIKALEQVQRRAARYVYNDYTSRTPGCVTEMVNELGCESLQDRRQISRLSLLYKAHHGLVDIDKATYLKPGDSRTRSHIGFTRSTLRMRSITTPSSPEQSGNGTDYQTVSPQSPPWMASVPACTPG